VFAVSRGRPPRGPVVFDCDGTLVATQAIWDLACATVAARHGLPLEGTDQVGLVGLTLPNLGHALAAQLGRRAQHDELSAEIYAIVTAAVSQGVQPLPGAVELVRALAGRRPLAVASNTERRIVVGYLTTIGLLDAFDVIVGSDDVPRPKPAPDVYLAAVERLGAAPCTAVAVEDSPVGVAAARAAGLYVFGVPSSAHLVLDADAVHPSLAGPQLRAALLGE
jgi:HAD superfamily hydrolase (TIGR01509 family)